MVLDLGEQWGVGREKESYLHQSTGGWGGVDMSDLASEMTFSWNSAARQSGCVMNGKQMWKEHLARGLKLPSGQTSFLFIKYSIKLEWLLPKVRRRLAFLLGPDTAVFSHTSLPSELLLSHIWMLT